MSNRQKKRLFLLFWRDFLCIIRNSWSARVTLFFGGKKNSLNRLVIKTPTLTTTFKLIFGNKKFCLIQSWQLRLLINLTTFFFVKLSKEKNIFCFDEILLCAYYKSRRARFNFLAAKKLVKSLGHQKSEITKRKTTGRHWKCGDFTIPHQNIQFHKHKYVFLFDILDFYKLP